MDWFWQLYLGEQDATQPGASPLRAESLQGLPAAYVVTAQYDTLRDEGDAYARRLEAAGVSFLIAPTIRFRGRAGEQGTFFVCDPSGNVLEFKTFRDPRMLFAR
jgi:acetyl esterase/lipase